MVLRLALLFLALWSGLSALMAAGQPHPLRGPKPPIAVTVPASMEEPGALEIAGQIIDQHLGGEQ
ncbi:MAG TPA: hypothetical protein VGK29_05600 [Paludibaculum sp.]|jgi:hypothetical protein